MNLITKNNKHYQECEVIMLEGNKTSVIYAKVDDFGKEDLKDKYLLLNPIYKEWFRLPKHLYFLSSEESQEGDWVLYENPNSKRKLVVKISTIKNDIFDYERKTLDIREIPIKWAKKIIATTDSSLLIHTEMGGKEYNGFSGHIPLPQPSPQFIKLFIDAYNSGKPITKVLAEYKREQVRLYIEPIDVMQFIKDPLNKGKEYTTNTNEVWKYDLVISKDNTIITEPVQDRLYTREEVEMILMDYRIYAWKTGCSLLDLKKMD